MTSPPPHHTDPAAAAEYNAARRSRRRDRVRAATREQVDRAVVFARDEGVCGICGTAVDPDDWHLDHIVPIAHDGAHAYDNVQVSHPRCNLRKFTRTAAD